MKDMDTVQIRVHTHVVLHDRTAPRKLLDALRRQVRHQGGGPLDHGGDMLPCLMESAGGEHRLPQALLPLIIDTCTRQQLEYLVDDQRVVLPCAALRARCGLNAAEQEILRRLMLRDSGVLVAPAGRGRALAIDLLARRQQRCLVLTGSDILKQKWLSHLRQALDLRTPDVCPLERQEATSRLVVGTQQAAARISPDALQGQFGMQVLDCPDELEHGHLRQSIARADSHYLLGLFRPSARPSGLQGYTFLALGGGNVHRLKSEHRALIPRIRTSVTGLSFLYEGRHQYQALVRAMAADGGRCQQIALQVAAEAEAGHPCLVLSERRDHLEALARLLPRRVKTETLSSAVRAAERDHLVDRFERGEFMVLMATSQIARESISTNRVSRLFLTFPFSYVQKLEQALGWLVRPSPGQKDAILFDFDDVKVAPLHRSFLKRQQVLKRLRRKLTQQQQDNAQLGLPL